MASLQMLNLFQSVIINGGLYAVSMYCAYLVSTDEYTVGDFVLLNTYFLQLMTPLNFLGTMYRVIQVERLIVESICPFDNVEEVFIEWVIFTYKYLSIRCSFFENGRNVF